MPGYEDAPREVLNARAAGQARTSRTHPMVIIAAGAVTLFAFVGIGVLTGVIPNANSSNRATSLGVLPTVAGAAQAPIATNADVAAGVTSNVAPSVTPIASEPTKTLQPPIAREPKTPAASPKAQAVASSTAPVSPAAPANVPTPAPLPRYETRNEQPGSQRERINVPSSASSTSVSSARTVSTVPDGAGGTPMGASNATVISTSTTQTGNVVATRSEPPIGCASCGTVDSINKVAEPGHGSGVGAVIGGVVGGAIGRQMGNGRGRDAATVAGAVAGGLIGNQVEKSGKTTSHFEVRVKLEDGTYQTVRYDVEPAVRVGDRVRIERGRVERIN